MVVDDGQLQTAKNVIEVADGRSGAGGTVLRMSRRLKQCQHLERQVSPLALLRERGQRMSYQCSFGQLQIDVNAQNWGCFQARTIADTL